MAVSGHKAEAGLEEGALIGGRYRVRRLLGRGGMGAVYEAEHIELGRLVALKTLLPQAVSDEKTSARLMQEGRAAAAIGHPGIVDVLDLVKEHGVAFVVMERLYGEELHDRIQRCGPLPVAFVQRMGVEVADAIAAAHAHGIVHRDLKPRNVFIAKDARLGEVFKVLDFGIAKLLHDADMRLSTHSGQVIGTPAYMAPERLAGELQVDGRADLYAIGALLYEALTGRPPFEASSYPELVLRICGERPRPIVEQRQDVPSAFVAAIERALQKDPRARQTSATALAQELLAIDTAALDGSGVRSAVAAQQQATATVGRSGAPKVMRVTRRRGWKVAAVTAVALVGGTTAAMLRPNAGRTTVLSRARPAQSTAHALEIPSALAKIEAPLEPAKPPAEPLVSPVPTLRRVRFETTPAKAVIWLDGKQRCASPCELDLPDRALELEAKLKGHLPARRTLAAPLPTRVAVVLSPRQRSVGDTARVQTDGLPPLLPR